MVTGLPSGRAVMGAQSRLTAGLKVPLSSQSFCLDLSLDPDGMMMHCIASGVSSLRASGHVLVQRALLSSDLRGAQSQKSDL